jgi:hypothetical protein
LIPVNEDEVPGYSDVVKEPMSLVTMEEKLSRGEYKDFDAYEVSSPIPAPPSAFACTC